MFKKITIVAVVMLVSMGCTITPNKVSMQNKIEAKVDVISIVNQQELDAVFPIQNSAGVSMQFGLIGALVGSAIDASANSNSAEKATNNLAPIRNKLINYNFDDVLQSNIKQSLMEHPTVSVGEVHTFKSYADAKKQMKIGNYYLKLSTVYKLDMDFRTPFIITYATLIKKGIKDRKDEVIYKNTFTYFANAISAPVKDTTANLEEIAKLKAERKTLNKSQRLKTRKKFNKKIKKLASSEYSFDESVSVLANVWATSKTEQLQSDLTFGIHEVLALLATDMADPILAESYKTNGRVLPGYPAYHKTVMIKDGDKRDVIRFADGHRAGAICSMPNLDSEETKLVCL